MKPTQQFCTFTLGSLHFGVHVRSIQEIIRHGEMTRVPTASAVVHGLINLRGQIVLSIDLHRRLGLTPTASEAAAINVIIRTVDRPMSLLVDQVGDILDLSDAVMEPPPDTIQPEIRQFLDGIYKLPDRLLLIPNVDHLADFDALIDLAA